MSEKPRNYLTQEERRSQLLELGLELFSEHSYDEVSTDEIARRAGVSKGLMYHYFGNKRGFYTAVVRFLADSILQATSPEEDRSELENLRAGLDAYFTFVASHGNGYLALINGGIGYDETIYEIIETTRQAIVDRIMDESEVRERPGPYRTAIRSWLGAVEAAATDWLAHKDSAREGIITMLIVSLFANIRVSSTIDPGQPDAVDPELLAFVRTILALDDELK